MPSYAELRSEAVWLAQRTPMALWGLSDQLSDYSDTPVWVPGDNGHLNGRHRSSNWCRLSKFCTNRSYGTTNPRDKVQGTGDYYRALDWAIQGTLLWDVCKRLDAAVRAGQLPGVAEWFGTFDGKAVVGWFEGRSASSDISHLTHLHLGVWTDVANDVATMDAIYDVLVGTVTPQPEEEDDMRGIVMTKPNVGIVLYFNHPVTGEPVYTNIMSGHLPPVFTAMGWGTYTLKAEETFDSLARKLQDVNKELMDAWRAGGGTGPAPISGFTGTFVANPSE